MVHTYSRFTMWLLLSLLVLSLMVATPALAQHHELDKALVEAVHNKDTTTARDLLIRGADANARDESGRYFFFARRKRYEPPFVPPSLQNKNLLIVDVDVELTPMLKWVTVLDIAVRANNLDLVNLLLDHGGDANSRTEDGYTLLRTAAEQAKSELVTTLLQHGAKVDARDSDGGTAVLGAVTEGQWPFGPFRTGRLEIVKMLLAKGADINVRDNSGNTVLYYAVVNGHTTGDLTVVKALLKAGANPNIGDVAGKTPLMWTAEGDVADLAKLLLDAGARVDTKDVYRFTALMRWASSYVSKSTATGNILLAHGANVNAQNYWRCTVLDLALLEEPGGIVSPASELEKQHRHAIIALLRKAGAKQSKKSGAQRSDTHKRFAK
jgi:hypothetical protein